MMGRRIGRTARRWSAVLGAASFAGLSMVVLEMDYREGVETLEATAVAVDNLSRARIAVADAAVASNAVQAGDATRDPAEEVARLNEAVGALDDLLEGRSALSAFRGRSPVDDPALQAAVRTYLRRVSAAREAATRGASSGGPADDAVARRIRLAGLSEAATGLEFQVYRAVERTLMAKRRTHRVLLGAWGGFLALVLVGFAALRAARRRALTARRRAERKARAAERRYTALERVAAVGLLRVDAGGTVGESTEWWSRVCGAREADCVGAPWWTLVPEGERVRVSAFWFERAAKRLPFSQDARLVDGEGRERWLTGRWEPAREGARPDTGWVGAFVDVTERRAVETQLHQAQKLEAVGRLTGGLAHDFNNLLSVILTNTHLLLADAGSLGAEGREMLEDVDRAAKGGRDLVKRLMGFSRRSELSLGEVDLSGAVRQSATLARKLLLDDITLELALPEPGPAAHADPRAVEQILLNLVTNARDAMPKGGVIRVAVDEVDADAEFRGERPWVAPGRYGRITVSDDGTGMDEDTLAQVFEPFFTTKKEGKGTGLGLSTVHGLVRQHGGHVRAYSQVGKGTTFRLYFPAPAPAPASAPAPAPAPGTSPGSFDAEASTGRSSERHATRPSPRFDDAGLSILLVDDDATLRRTSARMLVRLGYRVMEAGGGAEALEILGDPSARADIVMSDLSMPGMDGLELHRRLRARGDRRPFILTSGLSERDVDERGMLPEGAVFLPKPWAASQFLDLIATLDLRAG